MSLEEDLAASVQSLAERARKALGVGRGRLFTSSGSLLESDKKLGEAKLQTGDCLTLQVGTVRIHAAGVLQPSLETGLSSHGATKTLVVTAVLCKTS